MVDPLRIRVIGDPDSATRIPAARMGVQADHVAGALDRSHGIRCARHERIWAISLGGDLGIHAHEPRVVHGAPGRIFQPWPQRAEHIDRSSEACDVDAAAGRVVAVVRLDIDRQHDRDRWVSWHRSCA